MTAAATINQHGDIPRADVMRVRTVYGDTRYVSRSSYDSGRTQLRQYRRDGTVKGRFNVRARTFTPASTLHRGNIEAML